MSNEKNLINSIDRALRILDLFTEHTAEYKLTEISQALNLHKSTAHGLLRTLAYHGYISQNPDNGKYRLGMKLVERGNLALNSLDLRKIADTHLREIVQILGDTVHLVILDGYEVVYIDKVEGEKSILQYSRIGKRAPLYCTAVGKVLATGIEDSELELIAEKQEFKKLTKNTISSKESFIKEVKLVKEQGYAVDDEELEIGLRCLAVPIFDYKGRVAASISISGSSSRIKKGSEKDIYNLLKEKAAIISKELGYKVF